MKFLSYYKIEIQTFDLQKFNFICSRDVGKNKIHLAGFNLIFEKVKILFSLIPM